MNLFRLAQKHKGLITLVTGILGTVIGVLGLVLAYVSWQGSYDIAQRSGAFEKSDARLFLEQSEIRPGELTDVVYLMDFRKAPISVCKLAITVANAGTRTMKGSYLILRVPQFMAIPTKLLKRETFSVRPFHPGVTRTVSNIGNLSFIAYELPSINSKEGVSIEEPLLCGETQFNSAAHLKTKDSKSLRIKYSVEYSYRIQASISGEDQRPREYTFDVSGIQLKSSDKNIGAALVKFGERRAHQRRDQYSFFPYLSGVVSGAQRKYVMIVPQTKMLGDGKNAIQIPAGKEEVAAADLPLYEFWDLFQGSGPEH